MQIKHPTVDKALLLKLGKGEKEEGGKEENGRKSTSYVEPKISCTPILLSDQLEAPEISHISNIHSYHGTLISLQ